MFRHALAALVLLAGPAFGTTFSWTAPDQREDGSPLPVSEIAGYRIVCADQTFDVSGPVTEADVADWPGPGTHSCYVVTVDADGLVSAPSASVTFTNPGGSFGLPAPTAFAVQLAANEHDTEPPVMAVSLTSGPQWNDGSASGSQALNIPAGTTQIFVLAVATGGGYPVAPPYDQLNFDNGGTLDFNVVETGDYSNGIPQSAIYQIDVDSGDWPGTGSATLYWRAYGNNAVAEGGIWQVVYVQGEDSANRYADAAFTNAEANTVGPVKSTLAIANVGANDVVLGLAYSYADGGGMDADPDGDQTIIHEQDPSYGSAYGGFAYAVGEPNIAFTTNYPIVAGVRIPVGATAPVEYDFIGDGRLGLTSNATFSQDPQSFTGDGQLGLVGNATMAMGPVGFTGDGQLGLVGSAVMAKAPVSLAGAGQVGLVGNATFLQSEMFFAGDGQLGLVGNGVMAQAEVSFTGDGQLGLVGNAAMSKAEVSLIGDGRLNLIGNGVFSQTPVSFTGDGLLGLAGNAVFSVDPVSFTGDGQIGLVGSAVMDGPVPTGKVIQPKDWNLLSIAGYRETGPASLQSLTGDGRIGLVGNATMSKGAAGLVGDGRIGLVGNAVMAVPSGGTYGNIIEAASPSLADVQTAVNAASDGDVVVIPDGTATWNGGITTSKQIFIIGKNYPITYRGNPDDTLFGTKLRQGNGSGPMITMTSGNDSHCGVGGINFLRDLVNTPQYPYVRFVGAGSKVPLLFDCNLDCNKLNNGNSDTHGFVTMQSRGGVIWNIHWEARAVGTGTGPEPRPAGNDGSVLPVRRDGASWEPYTLGNQDTDGTANVYMEDCSAFGMGQFPDTDVNGKFVARYNRFSGSNGTVHGHTSGLPPRHSEYYENDFDLENAQDLGQDAYDVNGRWTYHRGGITVCHNNRLDTDEAPWSGRQVGLVSLVLECPGSNPNALGLDWNVWPVAMQAGMGWNGSAWERVGCWTWGNVATGGGNDPNYIGTGIDDTEIPPQPMSFYFQEGRDYFTGVQMTAAAMTAAGMPNPFDYVPYTYPHPARQNVPKLQFAASPSLADVQAAVDAASDGDTVLIPSGSATWTGGITTTKQIIIRALDLNSTYRGRKTQSVVITCNSGPIFSLSGGQSAVVGIGGIRFVEGSSQLNMLRLSGGGIGTVVWDCSFDFSDRYGSSFDNSAINVQGSGVVFWDCWVEGRDPPIAWMGGSNILVQNTVPWTDDETMGALDSTGLNNVYFEDSTFLGAGCIPDGDYQARWVMRHCNFDGTWGETHGYTGILPGRHWEWYNNDITNSQDHVYPSDRLFWCRGGSGIFTDNNFVAEQAPGYQTLKFLEVSLEGDEYEQGPQTYPIPIQPGWGYANGQHRKVGIWMWDNGPIVPTWTPRETPDRFSQPLGDFVKEGREVYTSTAMTVANGAPFDYQKYTYPHPARSAVEGS